MKTLTTLTFAISILSSLALASAPQKMGNSMGKAPMAKKSMMAMKPMMSMTFKGAEVNGGSVTVTHKDGRTMLKLSSDFQIPKAPAPHWQIVDGQGNVFLLQRLTIVGDKTNREITLPNYVKSVAKVQIWCSFAEVLLGETTFGHTISTK